MVSGPEWRTAGAARYFPAVARRAASVSPSDFLRSTAEADGSRAAAARVPAHPHFGASPGAGNRKTASVRASRRAMGRQSSGPPEGGTDCTEISVQRGGPQSFAAPAPRDLAPGAETGLALVGRGDSGPAGGVWRGVRGAIERAAVLANGCGVNRCSPLHDGHGGRPWA